MNELRYALQVRRPNALRWRTARSYDAARDPYALASIVMCKLAAQYPAFSWRIVLMPFNVLADHAEARDLRALAASRYLRKKL